MSPGDMINDKRTLRVWFFMNHPLLKNSAKIAAILHCVTEQADMGVYLTTWINTHQLKDDLPQAIACSDCG